jgi:hypothetical protein
MTDTGQEGVRDATDGELHGRLSADYTLPPDAATYRTPGPTVVLRGVEANTDESKGMPIGAPEGVTGYSCKEELPAGYGMGGMAGGSGDMEGDGD